MSNLAWGYTHSDLHTAPADFYQRVQFADPAILARQLGRADAEVVSVRYTPGRELTVVYRDERGLLTVRFARPGESAAAYAEALASADDLGAVLHLASWDAVAWRFPADPGLPGLRMLWAEAAAAGGLRRVLAYTPGERCALLVDGANGPAVAKLQRGGADASHRLALRAWAAAPPALRTPRPLGLDPRSGARWESFVSGVRLEELLGDGLSAGQLAALARGLVGFHRASPLGLDEQGPATLLRRIERRVLPQIGAAVPALAEQAGQLAGRLARAAHTLPARPQALLHGDLHTANLLIDGEAPALIDMDLLARGDPAYDLAMLGSRVLLGAILRGSSLSEAISLVETIWEAYREAGGQVGAERRALAWYTAALLLARQLKTCIRHCAPSLETVAAALLDLAEATLADVFSFTPQV